MKPKTNYFFGTDDLPWQTKTIAINAETKPEDCLGYDKKSIYFLSDTNGTLTIYADAVGDGDFQIYGTQAIVAATPVVYLMAGGARYIKLAFSVGAIVTAKYAFE